MARNSIGDNHGVWGESGVTRKASHRGHGGHRGGIWVGGQEFDRRQSWRLGRIGRNGESIAQRSRRSQRGDWGWWPGIRSATTWCLGGENPAQRGKHRTEVTEVTEGGFGLVVRIRSATTWRLGENRAQRGKHRTEVTEVTEGGFGLVARNSIGDNHGVWARIGRNGESIAQRSRGHGGLGSAARNSIGDNHGVWARIGRNGESIARRSPREIAGGGRNLIGEITASGRETAQRAILFAWVPQLTPRSSLRTYRPAPQFPPSVASVTSVRCYLFGRVLALTPRSSPRAYRPAPQFPPSVASVTSVRCFPLRAGSRSDAKEFTTDLSSSAAISPPPWPL